MRLWLGAGGGARPQLLLFFYENPTPFVDVDVLRFLAMSSPMDDLRRSANPQLCFGVFLQQCKHVKLCFRGVFAADNFPKTMRNGSFMVVNASKANLN